MTEQEQQQIKTNYIKTDRNKYLLLVRGEPTSNYDFYLTDGFRVWDGGKNCPLFKQSWKIITWRNIPPSYRRIREELYYAKSWLDSGFHCAQLSEGIFERL